MCFCFFRNVPRGSLAASPRSTKKGRKPLISIGNVCKNGFSAPPLLRAVFGLPVAPKRDNRPALSHRGLHRHIRHPDDSHKVPKMTPRQPRNNAKGPTNQRNNDLQITDCRFSIGWPVTTPQASSIRPPLRACRVKMGIPKG